MSRRRRYGALAAVRANAVLLLRRHPGDSIVAGTPIGSVWSVDATLDAEQLSCIRDGVLHGVCLGYERTAAHDVGFGLRQLTDVANKALSPGINDPTRGR